MTVLQTCREHALTSTAAPTVARFGISPADHQLVGIKNLTTVYITHGHYDHWFGLGTVLERFSAARVVAPSGVVEHMRQAVSPQQIASWIAQPRG